MIEVYYAHEIGIENEALLYYRAGKYLWSDYREYYPMEPSWHADAEPFVNDTPKTYIKLFEINDD